MSAIIINHGTVVMGLLFTTYLDKAMQKGARTCVVAISSGSSQNQFSLLNLFSVLQFLTNIFFIPYMALRQQPAGSKGTTDKPGKAELPGYAPALGWTGAVIGIGSVIWALAVRPEYGGLTERWQYFVQQTLDNRVFFAFVLDAVMYAAWQAILMDKSAPRSQRFVPFVGLVSYLVKGGRQ